MPVAIVAPTIVRFGMTGRYASRANCTNIVDVSLDEFGVSRGSAVDSIVPEVVTLWQDNMLANISNGYQFLGAHWLDIDSPDGHGGFQSALGGHPSTGDDGNNACSPAVAYLVHKACDASRRQRSGRMYRVGCRESSVGGDGAVDAGLRASLDAKLEAFRSGVSGLGLPLGFTMALRVVHVKAHNSDGDPSEWSSSDVTSMTTDPYVATQRRRQR